MAETDSRENSHVESNSDLESEEVDDFDHDDNYSHKERCPVCNRVSVDDAEECSIKIKILGKMQFCNEHFGTALQYLKITPPRRYFLAKPLSKKSTARRMIMDSDHIEEFEQWCKENQTIPYRYGIYCKQEMSEQLQQKWLMNECWDGGIYDGDDGHSKRDLEWYWPENAEEDYKYIIDEYINCDGDTDSDHIWSVQSKGAIIEATEEFFNYCFRKHDKIMGKIVESRERLCELQAKFNLKNV